MMIGVQAEIATAINPSLPTVFSYTDSGFLIIFSGAGPVYP
jgi:hypothetical protein